MSWRPELNVVCGRCGRPRGLTHVCTSGGKRKATIKPQVSLGKCPRCGKPQGNPLTHTCPSKKGDFKRRKAAYQKEQRAAARRARRKNAHDYQSCDDRDCARSLCTAYRTGYQNGNRDGHQTGWELGHERGFAEGQAACPRPHQ